MRTDSIRIEEQRIGSVHSISEYPSFHERHRVFPAVFENRHHTRVLDIASGVGVVGKRIIDHSNVDIVCNDISPSCLEVMKKEGIPVISFDIDDDTKSFPFTDGYFDAVISLASIEHIIHIDHYVREIKRILNDNGSLYISAPNYSGILYLLPFLISGKTFHDPLSEKDKYEFYAHVRYFTYRTMQEYLNSFGFYLDTTYLPLPELGSRYQALKAKSKLKAFFFRLTMRLLYTIFSPRWSSEPVLCFSKNALKNNKTRKIIL